MNNKLYTLLYAEDDPSAREIYKLYMEVYFKEVYEAKDGKEAYDIYLEKKPDVVMLDIEMPNMSGIQVAEKIREKDKNVKIVFLTAYTDKDFLLKAVPLNLVDYLVKPLNGVDLQALLKKTFEELEKDKSSNMVFLDEKSNFRLDQQNSILYKNDTIVDLTKYERKLLKLFSSRKNEIVSKEDIFKYVWNDEDGEYKDVNVRNLVKSLRKKLPDGLVDSIYGRGYILNLE